LAIDFLLASGQLGKLCPAQELKGGYKTGMYAGVTPGMVEGIENHAIRLQMNSKAAKPDGPTSVALMPGGNNGWKRLV
jgi:hypothetical protein